MLTETDSNTSVDQVTRKAAEYLGTASGYLQAHTGSEMLQDAKRLIRRFPEHSLITAAATGLLLGAILRRR